MNSYYLLEFLVFVLCAPKILYGKGLLRGLNLCLTTVDALR